MAKREPTCPNCGERLEPGSRLCSTCGTVVTPRAASDDSRESSAADDRPESPFATELNRRLARLSQWAEAAEPLGVEIPRLPPWAEEAAARSRTPEAWAEVVRGIERLAQRRIAEAFDRWEERTQGRIARLEAYSVDSRLERSQVEDAVHAAKSGDLASALATFQQVDRVVSLKERHLDQARAELEHLLAFLRDMEVLGMIDPGEPGAVATELERELQTGRLASLKQRLRQLHTRAVERTKETYARYVGELGNQLASDRGSATREDPGPRDLAIAARAIVLGHPEEGVRRLRALKEARGLTTSVSGRGSAATGSLRSA